MRRDVGRHADSNPARSVRQQIGEKPGKDFRLFLFPVISGLIVNCAVIETRHQVHDSLRHPRFGIAVGGRIVTVDIAEIALAIDQRKAQREILREPDHRVID